MSRKQILRVSIFISMLFILISCSSSSDNENNSNEIASLQAMAGEDQMVLEFDTITLDGSNSVKGDSKIVSYQWKQINTGETVLSMSEISSISTTFLAPDVSVNSKLSFELVITDENGLTSTDTVDILIRPTPGVVVGDVYGNTTSLNSVAEFNVRLLSQPESEVTIPIASSDVNEGETETDSLVFTPENWNIDQAVIIRGTNSNVQNGQQNYAINISPTQSTDPFYNNINIDNVLMRGIVLEISNPFIQNDFLPEVNNTLKPNVVYTGHETLSFILETAPPDMDINLSTGEISWIPQEDDEGKTFDVKVAVNDGSLFARNTFQINVVKPEPIQANINNEVLTVTDENSNLKGLNISTTSIKRNMKKMNKSTSSTNNINNLTVEKVPESSVPNIPTWIERLTDIFFIKQNFVESTEIRMPIRNLPENSRLIDVNLYSYVKADDIPEPIWSTVLVNISYEGTAENPVLVVKLNGLNGLFFFGIKKTNRTLNQNTIEQKNSNQSFFSQNLYSLRSTSTSNVTCSPRNIPFSTELNYNEQDCTYSGLENVNIFVKDFGSSASSTNWNNTTIQELICWLVEAQSGFDALGLQYDAAFNVIVEPMNYLGYVTTGNNENRRTLHITNANKAKNDIKGTAVHEYFHHAQGKSPLDGFSLLIDGGVEKNWLIEGTARWFEDYVFDNINTYVSKERNGNRILEAGLNSTGSTGNARPYQRFSFIKYLSENCASFEDSFINLMNVDRSTDPGGINKLANELSNASCNFGNHLGVEKYQSLEAALVYYQYATLFKNKISLLDPNESDTAFQFITSNHQFNQTWLSTVTEWLNLSNTTKFVLNGVTKIPAVGAFSFKVKAIEGELTENKVAEITFESDNELLVSIISDSPSFEGINRLGNYEHTWFSTSDQSSYIYNFDGTLPELFVTVVNPSLSDNADVEISLKIRDSLDADTIISSPQNGDNVQHRVISIVGSIPENAREQATHVVVSCSGLKSKTAINTDGSFVEDIIVSVGSNTIKAQAFNENNIPVTNEEIITINGQENNSGERNALVPTRAVFVLRWDTDDNDLDIYSTDKNNGTIWYSNLQQSSGYLDYDDTEGYGPEVLSYKDDGSDLYINGTFSIDVHYYSGSQTTNYVLNVILNETDGASNFRSYKFNSIVPHYEGNSDEDGPDGSGDSRYNDLINISCNNQGICALSQFDLSKLAQNNSTSSQTTVERKRRPQNLKNNATAYEKCIRSYQKAIEKNNVPNWSCQDDGSKKWD